MCESKMVKISEYLQDLVQQTSKGTCKACGKAVHWSQKKLASHKRANCPQASPKERRLFVQPVPATSNASDNDISMISIPETDISMNVRKIPLNKFVISEYLEKFDKVTQKGKCKSCSATVQWSRGRVASHKRSTCTDLIDHAKFKQHKSGKN